MEILVTGWVIRSGDRVAVTAALVDAASGKELSSRCFEGTLGDLERLRDTLVADAVRALTREFKSLLRPVPRDWVCFHNPRAYDLFLQGCYALRNSDDGALQEAVQRFHEAEELDSLALLVYVGLAEVYTALQASSAIPLELGLAKALGFAECVVAFDSTSAAARVVYGVVLDELWRWDVGGAELRCVVALDSGDAEARAVYGRHLLFGGDIEAVVRELDAAMALDPYSAEIAGLDGIVWVLQGQTKKGIEEARRGVDLELGSPATRLRLGAAYFYVGQPFDAVFILAGAVELDPLNIQVQGMLGYAYAAMGQPNKARAVLARLEKNRQRLGALAALGWIHIGLGQPDEALGLLEWAAQQHDRLFATESLHTPIFEPLKLHPRFERLLKRLRG